MSFENRSPFQNEEKKGAMICEKCRAREAAERHHRFSQTKVNKRLYGALIHDHRNIQELCYDCHHNKPVDKWTEKEFCAALGIDPRSKTERMKYEYQVPRFGVLQC
jgi:hypothetical protein